jgi:RNA polymerase sigma-70 factor (ECF subfamily)
MYPMTTEQLIKKCIERDCRAWDEFIRLYQGLVVKSVRYKLKKLNLNLPRSEFCDIVQEIFLYIWEKDKLSGVKDASCVEAWLAMVSVNRTFNYCKNKAFRRERNAISLDEELCPDNPGISLGSVLSSDKLSTMKSLESGEIREAVEREMSKLDHRQQLALKFNLYEGKTQKDIAEIMHVPENTVASLISRGKKRLKKGLSEFF